MITIIHGDDVVSSRNYLLESRKKIGDPPVFDGEKITHLNVVQHLEGGDLFAEKKSIVIENFLTRKKSSESDLIIELLQIHNEHEIILWEGKELTGKNLTQFKNATIVPFKYPRLLFQLLDSLKPNNAKAMISLFHKTKETTSDELIFFMIIRQFRILLALTDEKGSSIEELNRLSSWQKEKLTRQARLFSEGRLKEIMSVLFRIELRLKTGGLSQPLSDIIDFFLLDI